MMIINGQNYDLNKINGTNLLELVQYFNLNPKATAIEYNGKIIDRSQWSDTALASEDQIELIRFVGGG